MTRTPHAAALADVLPLIESLELPYLESLQQLLAEHIAERRLALEADARAKIARIAQSVGMSVEDILEMGRPRKCFAGQARYRDPATGRTWSGMGAAPLWIRGQDRSRFLVDGAPGNPQPQ